MDYRNFRIEDFASDESFINWVAHNDKESERLWLEIISKHPEIASRIDRARTLVINLKRAQEQRFNQNRIDSMFEQIRYKIESTESLEVSNPKNGSRGWFAMAAVITLSLISSGIFYFLNPGDHSAPKAYAYEDVLENELEKINDTDSIVKIRLEDGSVISLGSNSRIKYKPKYTLDSLRVVYLEGEAFFEVAPNPYKPFLVYSNEVVTKVLGTSFRIKAHPDKNNIVVAVKTGKVSVYDSKKFSSSDGKMNGVILLPNQQVNYEREQQLFDKEIVESPEIITPALTTKDFRFDSAPIGEVFKTLEDAYGIEILFNPEIMENCYITAPLGSEPLFDKLKIICQTINATYAIIDGRVVISSSGC